MQTAGKNNGNDLPEDEQGESNGGGVGVNPTDSEQLADHERVVIPEVQSAPWFAIRVRPNYEKPVAAALRGKGFQEFLPLIRSKRQWSDRVKIMDLPLFPGYLFCRLNLDSRLPLMTTPGFLYLVGVGKNPEPVDDAEIEGIQAVLRSGLTITPWPNLVVGQRVRLKQGPLRGLEGVLTRIANRHRIYVSVTLLQRSISVEVDPEWVQPVSANSELRAV
jgi:transcription termination/antitermination protein NusG